MKNSIMIFSVTKQSPNMKEMIIIHGASMPSPMQNLMMISDSFARDTILAWYHGEFVAANAIIDALCVHLTQLAGARVKGVALSEYDAVFIAIHCWRLN